VTTLCEEGGDNEKVVGGLIIASMLLASAGNAYAGAAVPEIDASGAVTALSVLAGVMALFADRLRRK
jgi:hypothetical protein